MANIWRLTVSAREIGTGSVIPDFGFLVNRDNTGDPFSPDPADWPSLRPGASHSPVAARGDSSRPTVSLEEGRYLVTVRAPGHKLGGEWVTLDQHRSVEVWLHRHPLPLSKIRVHVFEDDHPVNGEDDFPLEHGLPGFRVVLSDAVGEVTVDYFGNPLGTEYQKDAEGNLVLDSEGNPLPLPGTGGVVVTDANGDAVIDYLPPGKYGVQAIPPEGTDWVQTTTIEGTPVIDAWIEEGNDGYSAEEGFQMPLVWIGFVRPKAFPAEAGTGTITGRVRTIIEFAPPSRPLTLGRPVDRPWVALTNLSGDDEQVYTGRGNPDGTFSIHHVPAGLYQLAIWDEPLDYIISFRTVEVTEGATVNLGDVGIPRWFGWINGTVLREGSGEGIPNVSVGTRLKDGSVQYGTVTDPAGRYELPEVFELERFTVSELGLTRFEPTAVTATPEVGIDPPRPSEVHPDTSTLATLTWAATTNQLDWRMREYPLPGPDGVVGTPDDRLHGGISGIVHYATMRNELDPAHGVAEGYEPGIPGVTVNLYRLNEDGSRTLVNSTQTDAWRHPTDCRRWDGTLDPGCLEVPNTSNQIKPGVFDGEYAFQTAFDPYYEAPGAVERPLEPGTYLVQVVPPADFLNPAPDGSGQPLYDLLDPTSVNTGEGDEFAVSRSPAAPLSNPVPLRASSPSPPPDTASTATGNPGPGTLARPGWAPYYGGAWDTKLVTVNPGQNATADFFLYDPVPVPGRIVGFLLDDVNLETDPNKIYYGEKRGIPLTPVGIRDFTGRLLTTVHSDENGVFEVLLPSTYTANVPLPSGVVPGMYQVVGNDPGDPDRPNARYNPDYQTLKLVFDVWPGKTTYADVALFPITAFVGAPGAQFARPLVFEANGAPQLGSVNRVFLRPLGNRTVIIRGKGFGAAQGKVRLADRSLPVLVWWDDFILTRVPPGFPPGPAQLQVFNAAGVPSPVGITLHILGPGYNPPLFVATPETSIQAAIDAAPPGSLIVVAPGTYRESPILYKNVKLQGMGAGVTRVDGRFFASYAPEWEAKLASLTFDGPTKVPRGQVFTVVARDGDFGADFRTQLDGFTITGARGEEGGGIVVHAYCRYLEISNNVIQSNGGGWGGAISVGHPYAGPCANEGVRIHHNRILNNGGVSLAGGVGIFSGAHGYEFDHNDVCGNYSAEYGGGLSHYGLSDGGRIHHNRFLFNASFDEGGGLFVGGEKPAPPETVSLGSGAVEIYNNLVQGNVANDDGGGIRLLQPGMHRITIHDNIVTNNVSTDLGGGLALDDAPDVVIVNNTIAKNLTTATAEDSDGRPHAAGLASEKHSAAFQATLPPGAPTYSDPVLFNNVFWDNRAGWYDQSLNQGRGGIAGIGAPGDPAPVNRMDLEVFGTVAPAVLHPRYCSLSVPYGEPEPTNLVTDPALVAPYDTQVTVVAFNMQPDFKTVRIVTVVPELQGDYHLTPASPVIDRGTVALTVDGETFPAPPADFDDRPRPRCAGVDLGACEAR
ncbi:MAG: pectin esterase [Betaproteobacteria bacterium]